MVYQTIAYRLWIVPYMIEQTVDILDIVDIWPGEPDVLFLFGSM